MDQTTPTARDPRETVPAIILAALLLLTAVGTTYVALSVHARDRLRFDAAAHRVDGRIRARLATYTALLRATDGLFAARWPVYPKEFTEYANRLDLRRNYPGVFGIGLAAAYPNKGDDATFEKMMRGILADPSFHTWPESHDDLRSSIIYLEPHDERNLRALGYDMCTDPTRRAAMLRARDEGIPTATGRVVLVQDANDPNPQPGFLIYVPIYTGGVIPTTPDARRSAFRGWVYAPFRAADLFGDVLAEEAGAELSIRIFDGPERVPAQLLYQTGGDGVEAGSESSTVVDVASRPWSVVIRPGPGFFWWPTNYLPYAAAALGLSLSLSLFTVLRGQVRGRLRAERITDQLRQSQSALRRSEAKFRRLTDSNLVGVVFSRLADGRILDANDAFLHMVGHPRDDVAAGRLSWPALSAPEHRDADSRAVSQLLDRGVCDVYETEYLRKDGSRVPVMAGVARLDGAENETVGFAVDLTEVKRAQRALQEAKESAEAANRLKDEFLATVSHELRTPLNAVLGWAQLLASDEGVSGPDDVKAGIDTILRNARMQAQLIEDLLDISRIVSGKLRLEARPVELSSVVRAALDSVRLGAEAKGVNLVDDVGPATALVFGDPDRLQQVVWNLLTNSIKFTDRGGAVRVSMTTDADHVRVAVTDTGAGIDPDFLPYVFERFRQADASLTRKHGGLGLGLSIVKNLVEMHGGSASVHSEGAGHGSTFTIILPLTRAVTPRGRVGPSPARASPAASPARPLEGLHVLVVDDEPDARELVRQLLTQQRAHVLTAPTAARALEILRSDHISVLVSDLAMPEGDGYDLIRAVRDLPPAQGRDVPAIALSALVRPEERNRALAAGYQAHLPKPVEASTLITLVADLAKR